MGTGKQYDDTLLCFYYTLIVLYVSSFIIQDYGLMSAPDIWTANRP